MKQYITFEQWDKLNAHQRYKFNDPFKGEYFSDHDLPNIGQIIEFLMKNQDKTDEILYYCSDGASAIDIRFFKQELCDFLWEEVKRVLKT